ncbi:TIGR00304 family membrane protein [Thermosphaera sp.]
MTVLHLLLIGLAMIIAGILILVYSIIKEGGGRVEAAGLVMIGPIPILVASSRRIGLALLVITAAVLVALIVFTAGVAS